MNAQIVLRPSDGFRASDVGIEDTGQNAGKEGVESQRIEGSSITRRLKVVRE